MLVPGRANSICEPSHSLNRVRDDYRQFSKRKVKPEDWTSQMQGTGRGWAKFYIWVIQ